MRLSRRDALRAGVGLAATAGVAGCVERRVTSRETRVENGTNWALNPDVDAALDREAFEEYVDDVAETYDDAGVWGLEGESQVPDGFETAYVQRFLVPSENDEEAGATRSTLDPDADLVEGASPALVADAAVAVYEVDDARYRYWLWAAADGGNDDLVQAVDVGALSARVEFRDGTLADAAQVSSTGDEATVSLGSPPTGSFRLADSTTAVDSTSSRDDGGHYAVSWRGDAGGVQSINGVCEEERDGAHDFFWSVSAGYARTEQV